MDNFNLSEESVLSTIWIVFAESYVNPKLKPDFKFNKHEQSLIILLYQFLENELNNTKYSEDILNIIDQISKLLKIWSTDLHFIYKIRSKDDKCSFNEVTESYIRNLAQRILERIQTENIIVIPNGLTNDPGEELTDNICVSILEKRDNCVEWIQVDPGSGYHQTCPKLIGKKSNAYLKISKINLEDITEDWLYLLISLKTIYFHHYLNSQKYDFNSKNVFLYEWLLPHLNGETIFESEPNDDFLDYSPFSPVHTYQVIINTLRYLLKYYIGESYLEFYNNLITGFKIYLMCKALNFYQTELGEAMLKKKKHLFLFQEMCRNVAQQAYSYGDIDQKNFSLHLINEVQNAIKKYFNEKEDVLLNDFTINQLCFTRGFSSLIFNVFHTVDKFINQMTSEVPTYNPVLTRLFKKSKSKKPQPQVLKLNPIFIKPTDNNNIVYYLKAFKENFIDAKLELTDNIKNLNLLSYGIEVIFIEYLANTDILKKSSCSFSSNDEDLALLIKELAEFYYLCQAKLLDCLEGSTYQPQFYSKNIVIQFFAYAIITSLNLRDKKIGPVLSDYNLSTATNETLSLNEIIPHLVINDNRWLKVLLSVKKFFASKGNKDTLFLHGRYTQDKFIITIKNDQDELDEDLTFAIRLLKKYKIDHRSFIEEYRHLKDYEFHQKWSNLLYTSHYLPTLFNTLHTSAYIAKSSLMGFPTKDIAKINFKWVLEKASKYKSISKAKFQLNTFNVNKLNVSHKSRYLLKDSYKEQNENSYERFIIRKENFGKNNNHFSENEIICSQDKKPVNCVYYMELGFLQSESRLKLERLYIAIRDKQLDFTNEQENILINQTLFEISLLVKNGSKVFSLLEWTAYNNSSLIHKIGLLCIEKIIEMQYRLTQHHAIGNIIQVILNLLTFYPEINTDEIIENIKNVFNWLKSILENPSKSLNNNTLLHINSYLVIIAQAIPELSIDDILTILKSLLVIQNYKIKGIKLEKMNFYHLNQACLNLHPQIESCIDEDRGLLDNLMLLENPNWLNDKNDSSTWEKSSSTFTYSFEEYIIVPLEGAIYFDNQPLTGLPNAIIDHQVYQSFFSQEIFSVIPSTHEIDQKDYPCYESIDRTPKIRLTLIKDNLLIEELTFENEYLLFIPVTKPNKTWEPTDNYNFLSQLPHSLQDITHWLSIKDKKIIVKDHQRQILYDWDIKQNTIYSFQHEGCIVPWDRLEDTNFKKWLQSIDSYENIQIIVSDNHVKSINFTQLCLHFDYQDSEYFCRQIHGYFIHKQQYISTLNGFSNYIVLVKKEPNSEFQRTKIIIPHYRLKIEDYFYSQKALTTPRAFKSLTYFVYDLDPVTNLLKGHHIRAQLYLALVYYCSASMDDNDLSTCNSFHLARENLEACWKDQPYEAIELDIIEQFIGLTSVTRDFYCQRIAIFLKVNSLLIHSLRFAFLYTDKVNLQNKERSTQLLEICDKKLPELMKIYLMNKNSIPVRIRLSYDEEENLIKRCESSFMFYYQYYYENKPQVILPVETIVPYKNSYKDLFSKEVIENTFFVEGFKKNFSSIRVDSETQDLFFSNFVINIDEFFVNNFLELYSIAKVSSMNLTQYKYLLHFAVVKAKLHTSSVATNFVNILARGLLLLAQNPELFPEYPYWFCKQYSPVNLCKRFINKNEICESFPSFNWNDYNNKILGGDGSEEDRIKAEASEIEENKLIRAKFMEYDLNSIGVPNYSLEELPQMSCVKDFTLKYERHVKFTLYESVKKCIVRKLYAQAAYNDAMYNFFLSFLQKCDEVKTISDVGQEIALFQNVSIEIIKETQNRIAKLTPEEINQNKMYIPEQPMIVNIDKFLEDFFVKKEEKDENEDFLFESVLNEAENEYQKQFYNELRNSWLSYKNEIKFNYFWLNINSLSLLEDELKSKYMEIGHEAAKTWNDIVKKFKNQPCNESNNFFALRSHAGQSCHYHKGDILRLLIQNYKMDEYNPDCFLEADNVIQKIITYVNNEINLFKIVRALGLIHQYKQAKSETEQFSITQFLVDCLKENVSEDSYRFPHWLLFQLENEIIIRDNQRQLILDMLSQNEKVMYQLNMGEGKSSVILPLLSYNLTKNNQLLRIIVLPSLLNTMKDLLQNCFSGLVKKRVYTLPFYRSTDTSSENLKLILQMLEKCQSDNDILLVTPEHQMCLQLKFKELLFENQQQINATNVFNWKTYRQRAPHDAKDYKDLSEQEVKELLSKQDKHLKICLQNQGFIDACDNIRKVPERGLEQLLYSKLKQSIGDTSFREWSCLKAAFYELLFNSKLAYENSKEKLELLNKINHLKTINLLDESDEILKHGKELNYSMGDKHQYDGGETRWKIPQFFLKVIFCDHEIKEIIKLGKPDGFTIINEHFSQSGGIPFIQILNEPYYEKSLKPVLIEKFFIKNNDILRRYKVTADDNLFDNEVCSLRKYVAGELETNLEKSVMRFLSDKGVLKDKLLLAKGWLTHGILFHVFNVKYRVQYGLNLHMKGQTPKQIAIPFWGKDAPSPRSEFSHPDVMLGFTIISYLYEGLDQEQLKKAILKLKNKYSNQSANEIFRKWVHASETWIKSQTDEFPPKILTSLMQIDLDDEVCLSKIHHFLSSNHLVIFFYLNEFVFIEEATQYRFKISANAHSLVGYNPSLGFSGTDDKKITMPFQVKSLCSKSQEGTNGKLLSVLTQERNSRYYSLQSETVEDLLNELCDYVRNQENCHALIDAGALVTGLSNFQVASFFIKRLPDTFLGVIYFCDKSNNLNVLTRDEKTMVLQDCYLDYRCLFAYLDDIHTRGTDIKLPLNAHAILTIGIGMEKDKLMQAAMRLRQLAQKQSVSLWGTQAVTLAITRGHLIDTEINSEQVIKYVTQNTTNSINNELFAVSFRKISFQFLKQAETWLKEAPTNLDSILKYCQEKEQFYLEEFYAATPQYEDLADRLHSLVSERVKIFWQDIENELNKKKLTGSEIYNKVVDQKNKNFFRKQLQTICEEAENYLERGFVQFSLDDDEEKEVEVEVIKEQEILIKVLSRNPFTERLWDVNLITVPNFIQSARNSEIIIPIERIKDFIQDPADLKGITWNNKIFMTKNYIKTIEGSSIQFLDNYLRPVDVVLVHRIHVDNENEDFRLIVLSGKEASAIKSTFDETLEDNILIHINDINGPSKFPITAGLSEKEQKLLTTVKLFAGKCHYTTMKEVCRLSKRVGRLYSEVFTACNNIDSKLSEEIYQILIDKGYLDFSGIMSEKLLIILEDIKADKFCNLQLTQEYQIYAADVLKKLYKIYTKLIIKPNVKSSSLKDGHNTLRQWISTRGNLKEYSGSALESVLNSEYKLKISFCIDEQSSIEQSSNFF